MADCCERLLDELTSEILKQSASSLRWNLSRSLSWKPQRLCNTAGNENTGAATAIRKIRVQNARSSRKPDNLLPKLGMIIVSQCSEGGHGSLQNHCQLKILSNSRPRLLSVDRVQLDKNCPATRLSRRNSSGPGSGKWIKDNITRLTPKQDTPSGQFSGEDSRMWNTTGIGTQDPVVS